MILVLVDGNGQSTQFRAFDAGVRDAMYINLGSANQVLPIDWTKVLSSINHLYYASASDSAIIRINTSFKLQNN